MAVCIETKGLIRLSASILEARVCAPSRPGDLGVFMYVQSESFAMICLVYFDALYIKIYCLGI